ncbi:hypothetical protein BJF78_20025 [Pseudonocardia sp. CNS-139]|nr:hypothetical protein BJF78_20025 [Pseudonocardia sp. CNS-139]
MEYESEFDISPGPLVRPFAIAKGRTRPGRYDLDMITLVVALAPADRPGLMPEYAEILEAAQRPQSVAEVAAAVNLPMAVVKVLLSDLIERGDMIFRSPPARTTQRPDPKLLQAVLDGIRNL